MAGKQERINLICLTSAAFIISVGYSMIVPFLPLYIKELGVSPQWVPAWSGVIFSATFLVSAVIQPFWGRLADTMGRKAMAVRAIICIGIAFYICGMAETPWGLLAARLFQGFANGFVPAAMAVISSASPQEKLGVRLGLFQTGLVSGNVCGPLAGGILGTMLDIRTSFLIVAVMHVLMGIIIMAVVRENKKYLVGKEEKKSSVRDDFHTVFANTKLLHMLGYTFIFSACMMMLQPTMALYISNLSGAEGNGVLLAGIVLSCGGLAGSVTAPLWGRFGQQHGYWKALYITFFFAGLFLFGQAFPRSVISFAVFQCLVGAFLMGVTPSINALISLATPSGFRGRAYGMNFSFMQFGNMAGPLAAGIVSMTIGASFVFMIAGVLLMYMGARLYMGRERQRREEMDSYEKKNCNDPDGTGSP